MLFDANGALLSSMPQRQYGRAERQPLAEDRVRYDLKQIDPLLDVQWHPSLGRYMLVCNWPMGDARWQLYQNGEVSASYDFIGWFTEDMHDADSRPVSVDMMESRVMELLGKCDNTRFPIKERMEQVIRKNVEHRRRMRQPILDQTEALAADFQAMSGRLEETTLKRVMKEAAKEGQHDE